MKRKYSIIKNHIGNDLYALVLKSWLLDEDNNEIDILCFSASSLYFNKMNDIELKFIEICNKISIEFTVDKAKEEITQLYYGS